MGRLDCNGDAPRPNSPSGRGVASRLEGRFAGVSTNAINVEPIRSPMPRIIVTTDPSQLPDGAPVLFDEQVHSVHLSTGHAAAQLVQRLAWAISDAEDVEGVRPDQRARPLRQSLRIPLSIHPGAHLPIRA
jgi:hypothetical protein